MQPSTEMMSYQNPPIMNEDDDAVPFITTITITQPTTTTMGHRLSKRIVIVAGTMMMLTMAGGTVWRLADTTDGGRTTTTTAARGSCRYQGWRGERARWHCISTFGSSRIVVSWRCSGLPLCFRDGDVWWEQYDGVARVWRGESLWDGCFEYTRGATFYCWSQAYRTAFRKRADSTLVFPTIRVYRGMRLMPNPRRKWTYTLDHCVAPRVQACRMSAWNILGTTDPSGANTGIW